MDLTHRPPLTLSSPSLNLDLRAEILKAVRDSATAQQNALMVNIEGMRTEFMKSMKSRQEERDMKLALLLEGRQTRVTEMEKWKKAKKDISITEENGGSAAAVLKNAIVQLPRMIHTLDHFRMAELEQQNQREEEEDCLELEAWRKQHAHLATTFKQQSKETLARVAQLWKEATEEENGMHKTSAPAECIVHILVQEAPQEKTTLAPVISSENAVTLALPLPSKLPPLPSKLPPLASKVAHLPAKLPPLNPGLRRAFCNPVAPLPPIHPCKYEKEDLEVGSISEHSTKVSEPSDHQNHIFTSITQDKNRVLWCMFM
ncbi:uncharacterized protein LOC134070449 [Sardina pilchardus]|uniref:uncharacterized protein LOC134070449 n=1 Tax=Sardina pilchardus TaxID=27697 RepID=UPI002E0F7085